MLGSRIGITVAGTNVGSAVGTGGGVGVAGAGVGAYTAICISLLWKVCEFSSGSSAVTVNWYLPE